MTAPVTAAASAGLAAPYIRVALDGTTISVAGVMVNAPLLGVTV